MEQRRICRHSLKGNACGQKQHCFAIVHAYILSIDHLALTCRIIRHIFDNGPCSVWNSAIVNDGLSLTDGIMLI